MYSTAHRMTTATFAAWLRDGFAVAGSEATVVEGRIADMPSLSVSVEVSGSGEAELEHAFETIGIHIQARGRPNNLDSAETLALLVDDLVLNANTNFYMGDVYVTSLWRPGPRPQQLSLTDPGDRFVFSGNYQAQCSTGVGATLPGLG